MKMWPGGRLLEAIDASQERRLARTRRAEDDDHLALGDLQVHSFEHLEVVEALVQALDADHGLAALCHRRPTSLVDIVPSGIGESRGVRAACRASCPPRPVSATERRCSRFATNLPSGIVSIR
jgi:hypothetical protein